MKIGFITSILDGWSFEETIDIAERLGCACVEVACWPSGGAERRYAGVSHIDVARVLTDNDYAAYIPSYAAKHGITISALAYYPNVLDADPARSTAAIGHLETVIRAAAKLQVGLVTTFIGRDQNKSVEENLELLPAVWNPLLALAEEQGVRIAIENCPMLFGRDQWPGGQNLFTSPANWDAVFERLPSPNLGINYDPSHFVWQMMDYIAPIYRYREKLFHVHFKDIKLYPEKLNQVGIMAYPLEFMAPKLPGLGDVQWGRFVSALTDVGYQGYACIEVEDRAFEGSREQILKSLQLSKRYLDSYVIA